MRASGRALCWPGRGRVPRSRAPPGVHGEPRILLPCVLVQRLSVSTLNHWAQIRPCESAGFPGPGFCAFFSPGSAGPLLRGTPGRLWRASRPCRAHALHLSTVRTHVHAPAGAREHPAGRAPPSPPLRAAAPGVAFRYETAPWGDIPFPRARTPAPTAQTGVRAEPRRSGSRTARVLPGRGSPFRRSSSTYTSHSSQVKSGATCNLKVPF